MEDSEQTRVYVVLRSGLLGMAVMDARVNCRHAAAIASRLP